ENTRPETATRTSFTLRALIGSAAAGSANISEANSSDFMVPPKSSHAHTTGRTTLGGTFWRLSCFTGEEATMKRIIVAVLLLSACGAELQSNTRPDERPARESRR